VKKVVTNTKYGINFQKFLAKQGRFPMGKSHYRVRNWKEYNKVLVDRGNITVWIEEKSIQKWYAKPSKKGKRGRRQKYSDVAVQTMLVLKQVYGLDLRRCEGFTQSLLKILGVEIKALSYTQLCRRQASVKLPKLPCLSGPIHMVIDSTGLKVFGEGEWKVRRHGWSKHRMWRKWHIGVDEKSKLIVSSELTGNESSDDKVLPIILKHYPGKIYQVSADGAYDSHAVHDEIEQYGALGVIPPQPNPQHKPKRKEDIKKRRDEIVWSIQEIGRAEWKKQSNYHRRSLVENCFSRGKQLLGEKLAARTLENQRTEVMVKCHILNTMTLLGMPSSVAVD
jgi:hypothetical protein